MTTTVPNRHEFAVGLSAMKNASRDEVCVEDLLAILSTGNGPGHLVRALFGDCTWETLDRMSLAAGLSRASLHAAYATAKSRHHAANAEIDGADRGLDPT